MALNPTRRVRHPASENLRRVAPYFTPHRGKMWFVALSAVVSIVAGLTTPLLAKAVIDGPIADGDRAAIVPWAVAAVVLGLIEASDPGADHQRHLLGLRGLPLGRAAPPRPVGSP